MGPIGPGDLQALLQALATIAHDLNTLLDPAGWLTSAYNEWHQTLVSIFRDLLFGTGDAEDGRLEFVHGQTVTHYEPYAQAVADLGLVAITTYAFFRMMLPSHSARNRYTIHTVLPRLMLAVILINFSLPLYQGAIDVNNALCATIANAASSLNRSNLFDGFTFEGPGLTLLVLSALFLGYVVLAFVYVIRYAMLVVLAITAPIAALLFVLHETHHYARLWSSLFVSTLFMQPLQLLILAVGFGLETEASLPIKHAFGLAALFITFKVPGALHMSSSLSGKAFTELKRHATHGLHHLEGKKR